MDKNMKTSSIFCDTDGHAWVGDKTSVCFLWKAVECLD